MKLDIGGGFNRLVCLPPGSENKDEYTVVDKYKLDQPNTMEAPAWDIPVGNESVDEIYSSHMLEHMPFNKVEDTLKEWFRILKTGGRLRLYLPDLEYCVDTWRKAPEEHPEKWGWFIKIIFGGQEYEGDAHLTGFTHHRVRKLLRDVGFTVADKDVIITWCSVHNQQEIRAEIIK